MQQKAFKGKNYLAGLAVEHSVIADYTARSYKVLAHRWRGQIGEIDLIFVDGDTLVFTEVIKVNPTPKTAGVEPKTATANCQTASEFLTKTNHPFASKMRFDVALVDIHGDIKVLGNALMH